MGTDKPLMERKSLWLALQLGSFALALLGLALGSSAAFFSLIGAGVVIGLAGNWYRNRGVRELDRVEWLESFAIAFALVLLVSIGYTYAALAFDLPPVAPWAASLVLLVAMLIGHAVTRIRYR